MMPEIIICRGGDHEDIAEYSVSFRRASAAYRQHISIGKIKARVGKNSRRIQCGRYFSLPDRTTPAGIALTAGICVIFASRNLLTYSAGLIISSFTGSVREPPGSWQLTQLFSAAALLLILPYRGSAGPSVPKERPVLRKAVQLAFYAFYPLHMLALSLIYMLIK